MSSPDLDTLFNTSISNRTFSGAVACAASLDGSFRYTKSWGYRKLAGEQISGPATDEPYTPDSVFRIASCTKLITSIAALQCVEKGLLQLDEDVAKWLPELDEQKVLLECDEDPAGKETLVEREGPVTLRHLLTHSGGTPYNTYEPLMLRWLRRHDRSSQTNLGQTVSARYLSPFNFQPGTSWAYGSGHDWAGKLVELCTGLTLEEYMQTHIFAPLGITQLTFFPSEHLPGHDMDLRAVEPAQRGQAGKIERCDSWPHPAQRTARECFGGGGGGGLAATMPDYLKVLESLLRNDGRLLRPDTVEGGLFAPQLGPEAREDLNQQVKGMNVVGPGFYPKDSELDWGLGAMLTVNESGEYPCRGAGTLTWGGYPNLFWFVDRKRGLCGIFGTMFFPSGDKETKELTCAWEKEMYRLAVETRRDS